ncbi:hypothetical protein Theam_1753 (plasmid) [Thermovibrio ammonificans HB-1]|uniref:Uncharacterized protein n=1 Tax=Thermovibrio ammonificans (strain DSM 15698 / JCM 12110 / HB-1) TaxID=648996 RepID=E8T6Y8_THEA1|nr:hypothetical protein [Thermovibrio ammonificans]ADU97709.1 hypothetical protein Theam_1753 [Thermovibrio ammonificans HB-1]
MEKKHLRELLEEIYGGQTNALERAGRLITAWKVATGVFAFAFLITLGALLWTLTHPFEISVKGLPVRGVGGFGVDVVTPKQLKEFGKNATYLLCNLNEDNLPDRFDALETISTPDWAREIKALLPDTERKFRELQMTQTCSVEDSMVEVKPLARDTFLVKVPARMHYWIKGRETQGVRYYTFVVKTCPATGENPYGFCIKEWEIKDVD